MLVLTPWTPPPTHTHTPLTLHPPPQAKELIEGAGFEKGGKVAIVGSAAIAGFFASACSLPFDFIKTRLQKMTPNPDGSMPYKGPIDCAAQTLRNEGPLKFYTGFPTFCLR